MPNPPAWCYPQQPTNYVETMQRFMDEFRLDYVWMPGDGPQELGIHDAEVSASFAIPFFRSPSPLLVTPGFATNWFNGPSPPHFPPPGGNPVFPPRLYEAYLDTSWNPQPTPEFGGELSFRIGVYSDFDRVTNESIRYMGKGYGVISLSPNMKVKAGIQYLDRQKIKLLPAGGLIWTPNSNTKFEILFPDPRLAWRLRQVGNMEWWFYGRGEYGGDSWTIDAANPWTNAVGGGVIETDYNDYRVAIGMEFDDHSRWDGYFEVGYAFEREIYQWGMVTMRPNSQPCSLVPDWPTSAGLAVPAHETRAIRNPKHEIRNKFETGNSKVRDYFAVSGLAIGHLEAGSECASVLFAANGSWCDLCHRVYVWPGGCCFVAACPSGAERLPWTVCIPS